MAELAKAYVQIVPSLDGVTGSLESAFGGSEATNAASSAGAKSGGAFSGAFGKAMGGVGSLVKKAAGEMTSFAASSVSVGKDFDAAMAQVAATMGKSMEEIQNETGATSTKWGEFSGNLREYAQFMGAHTAFSASQAAEALNYMALAGYKTQEAMEMLPTVLDLAAAGGIDLASASDMVTDAQSALGLGVEGLTNETSLMVAQMAKGSSITNTSVAQLGEAFLKIGGTAKGLSGGTHELTQMLGVLADNGIKGAEAGTHLRNIMLAMNPTTDKAAAAWESLGVEAYDANGSLRPLSSVFGDLSAAMADMSDQEKTSTLTAMFNKTDLSAINALLATTSERYAEISLALSGVSYSQEDMNAALQQSGIEWSKYADTAWQSYWGIEEGVSGLAEEIAWNLSENGQSVADMIDYVSSEYDLSMGDAKIAVEAVQKALQSTSSAASDMAETQLDNLAGDMTLFQSALEGAKIAVSDTLTPALREMVGFGSDALSRLTTSFQEGGLDGAMTELGTILSEGISGLLSKLPQMISAGSSLIGALVKGLVNNFPQIMSAISQALQTLIQHITQNLPQILSTGALLLETICTGIIESLPAMREAGMNLLNTLIDYIVENLPTFIEKGFEMINSIIDGIMEDLPNIIDTIVNVVTKLITTIGENLPLFLEKGLEIVHKLIEGILNNLPKIVESIITILSTLIKTLVENLPKILEMGIKIIVELGVGLVRAIPQLVAQIPKIVAGIFDAFLNTDWLGLGADIIAGIGKGIKDAAGGLIKGACNVVSDFVGGVADFFGIGSPSKLMRDEIGRWIPEGMAVGIEEEAHVVNDAMDALGEQAYNDLSYQVAAMPSLSGAELAFAGVDSNIVIPVYIGDEQIDTMVVDAARRSAYRGGGR